MSAIVRFLCVTGFWDFFHKMIIPHCFSSKVSPKSIKNLQKKRTCIWHRLLPISLKLLNECLKTRSHVSGNLLMISDDKIRVMWNVGDIVCWECGTLGMPDFGDVGCSGCRMFRMLDVQDLGCLECGMFGMWDVWYVGCLRCGMFGMWNIWDVGCLKCGMFGMWDVSDVGCRMFGMWDVWDVKCSGYGMFEMWDVRDVGCLGCGMLIYRMSSLKLLGYWKHYFRFM